VLIFIVFVYYLSSIARLIINLSPVGGSRHWAAGVVDEKM
jgi:hypothetical protein